MLLQLIALTDLSHITRELWEIPVFFTGEWRNNLTYMYISYFCLFDWSRKISQGKVREF